MENIFLHFINSQSTSSKLIGVKKNVDFLRGAIKKSVFELRGLKIQKFVNRGSKLHLNFFFIHGLKIKFDIFI